VTARGGRYLVLLASIGLSLTLGVGKPLAAPAISFSGPQNFRTGQRPTSIAVGDLNGDRRPDLATANDAGTVSVFLNRGLGQFRPRLDYPVGGPLRSVAIGDLNADEKSDLVTASWTASTGGVVSVLMNRGGGHFATGVGYRTAGVPWSLSLGDLNDDGRLDVATASGFPDAVSVLVNRGDGSFAPEVDYPTGSGPIRVRIADLNGDRAPDVVTANLASSVSILTNNGDGTFQHERNYPTGYGPHSVATGDLNHDHATDVVTGNSDGQSVSVLINKGNGTFRPKIDFPSGQAPRSVRGFPHAVAIGDLNGDGKPEITIANSGGPPVIAVLTNKGRGRFEQNLSLNTCYCDDSIALVDLNQDGRRDIAGASFDYNTVTVFTNTTGLCTVPNVRTSTLSLAKHAIAHAHCRIGKIGRSYSRKVAKGRVISEKPKPGTVLPSRGEIDLVVSLGRRP
jgi:hypothetical protein